MHSFRTSTYTIGGALSKLYRALITPPLKTLLNFICSIDASEYHAFFEKLQKINLRKPFIIALNHINFLEVPMLVTSAHPAPVTGLVQANAWKNRFMGFLFDAYDAIPINREGSYLQTFRKVREAMENGFFVCIAPEGKRSGDGILRKAKGGIVQLSLITGAPILPVAHFGGQNFWHNIKRFKRTPFTFRIGCPFRLKIGNRHPQKEEYSVILEEVMAQIACLLPEELRGEYAASVNKECKYLEFLNI
jgi:1-acyl-sn-glycerol-3-phosphate acyltransferase